MKRLAALALVAGCATPTTPTVAQGLGEDPTVTVGTVSTPSPVARLRNPRPAASKASRTRGVIPQRSGSLTSVTCYAATGHRTASGKWPRVGMAASNSHPFGTRLLVEHLGVVTVEDRIGHGTELDLFGPSESYCRMTDPESAALVAPNFEGHEPRECGEHRTVGPHRAWCFDCGEWCYPEAPCVRCEERPMSEPRPVSLVARIEVSS